MKRILLIVLILLCSSFVGINPDASASSNKTTWVEVDRISTTIEIDPMGSYYFQIENNETKYITQEKIPVMDALKRVPNWLREDLEKNFEKMAYVDIDVGEHAAPTPFDIDDDGDYDLVVGTIEGKLLIYENSNNVWIKKVSLNDSNGNPIDVGDYAVPTFFDLYNDGKTDLIVGAADGRIRYYENTTEGFVYEGYLKDNNDDVIDVGSYSAPAFAKVYMHPDDSDGKDWDDMVVGASDGKLYFYENTINGSNPRWTERDYILDDIDVGDYSKPTFADLDGDGDEDLTVGADDGTLHYYERTGGMTNPSFTEDDSMYQNMETSAYAAPVLADMDKNKLMIGNCSYDIVVGRGDGHIHLYKNVGTSSAARWDVFPYASESVSHHLQERNLSYLEEYVNLILDVENEYVDEIAFCIAHTSVDVLTDEEVYLNVFKKNAELLYEIDPYIKYANLVEVGNYSTGDYYTTIRYNYSQDGVVKNTTLPRDVYYWFVVHPKITDEIPTFINPETGRPDESGVFWREYLFYYADKNYPSDPNTDPNSDGHPDYYYPKDETPPLLKDKISNVTIMYDNVPYTAPAGYDNDGHNNERPWNYTHAVEVVSNWVEKTLPLNEQESDDGERPIQPVRIAHHHNGNCGELQDLTVAAARTCMIPAAGVSLIGEDHVWSEFYCLNESGDYHWHQWDNYWSDSGSVIDNFDNYWVNWGHRGGSGIFKWKGDDSITDVTGYYVPTADVTKVVVNDAEGNPVDGAKVVISSYWLTDNRIESISRMTFGFVHYVPGAAVPSIWGYTDSDGTCEFRLVGNFTISVSSKIGSDEETNIYIGEEGKTATRFDYGMLTDEDNVIKWKMNNYGYPAGGDIRNREDMGWVSGGGVLPAGNYTLHYITDRTHAYNSWKAEPPDHTSYSDFFDAYWGIGVYKMVDMGDYWAFDELLCSISEVGNKEHITKHFNLIEDTDIYVYAMGEWGNKVEFTLDDTIAKPALNIGGHQGAKPNYKIELEYNVLYDEQDADTTVSSGLVTFEGTGQTLKTGRVNSYIDFFTCGKENMVNYLKGQTFYSNLSVLKTNERSNTLSFHVENEWYIVFSNDKSVDTKKIVNVTIILKREQPWSPTTTVDISTNGFIQGDASSFVKITEIKTRVDDNDWITAWSGSQKNVAWNYSLNMTQYYLGKHTIYVKVMDADGYSSITAVEYTFACLPTAINIASPKKNEMIEKTITVSGTASDINIIQKMWVKIGDGKWADLEIIEEEGKWNWRNKTGKGLDTTTMNDGEQKIYVKAFNGIIYTVASVDVIVDNNLPTVSILSPSDGAQVAGILSVYINAYDSNNVKISTISIDDEKEIYDPHAILDQIPQPTPTAYTLSGYVYDHVGIPLNNACVLAYSSEHVNYTYTNTTGYYSMVLPVGDFSVVVGKTGYVPYTQEIGIAADFSLSVKLPIPFIYGYIKDSDSNPLSEVVVSVTSGSYFSYTYTDVQGYYQIKAPAGKVTVVSGKTQYTSNRTTFSLGTSRSKELDITLSPHHEEENVVLDGYVEDTTGNPLKDVLVCLYNSTYFNAAFTDASGHYMMNVPAMEGAIIGGAFDFAPHEAEIIVDISKTYNFTLTSSTYQEPSDITIDGNIRNQRGNLQLGVFILAFSAQSFTSTYTGSSGYYKLILPPGQITILCWKSEYWPFTYTKYFTASQQLGISLEPSHKLYGFVQSATNKPMAQASVLAEAEGYYNYTYTDSAGYYELDIPSGEFSVTIGKNQYAPYSTKISVTLSKNLTIKLSDSLIKEQIKMYGHIYNYEGKPLANAFIFLTKEDYFNVTTTDDSGNYELNVSEGTFSLIAWVQGYAMYHSELTVKISQQLNISLNSSEPKSEFLKLYGYVTNKTSGEPLNNALITLFSNDYFNTTYTNESGFYELITPKDNFTLLVGESHYKPFCQRIRMNVTKELNVSLEYQPILPMHELKVYGKANLGSALVCTIREDYFNVAYTDTAGYYEVSVPDGEFQLIIGKYGYIPYIQNITLNATKCTEVLPIVPAATIVYGNVIAIDDTPVPYTDIYAYSTAGYFNFTYTNETGFYEIMVPKGEEVTLLVYKKNYTSTRSEFTITTANEQNFILTSAPSYTEEIGLTGYVLGPDGKTLNQAFIYVSSESYSNVTLTDETGYYYMNIPRTPFTIIVCKENYLAYSKAVGYEKEMNWHHTIDTTKLLEGAHTIYISAFDGLHYHNKSVNITVDNNRPPEILYSPANDNIAIKENSTQEFRIVNAVDSDGNISAIKWYLDDAEITACANQTSYKFVADYDSSGSYQIKVEVWDDFWDKEAKIRIWNLTVENVNRAPVIESFTPTDSTITMNEGESKTFSIINASDPDGTVPTITWYRYLNGESKGDPKGSGSSYTFYSNYTSSGNHVVEAVVSDGEKGISRVWILTVKDVNRAFTFNGFAPNQTVIEMKKGMAKTFSVNADDPEDTLTIKWDVNGENVGSGDSYTFIPTSYGTYIVSVILSDGEKTETCSWTINVKKPRETPGFEITFLLMILGALIVLRKITKKKNI